MTVLRYEKVAPVSHDFIEDLIHGLDRVITPDAVMLREVLILSGMPRKTENLRYMSYNRQVETARNRVAIFSAVAVINNRRAQKWQLRATGKNSARSFSTLDGPAIPLIYSSTTFGAARR